MMSKVGMEDAGPADNKTTETGKARRSRLPAEARKAEIVAATLRLSESHGPDGLTTEMIAADIGLTQPALFRHFPKKDMIWTAVAEQLSRDMAAARAASAGPELAPADCIIAIAAAQALMIAKTTGLASILFSRELHVRNAELRAGLAKNQQALHAELEAAIARGISDGTLRSGISASDAAFLVIAILQGLALRWSLTGKRLDLVKEAGRLVRLAVEGFRA
ncbi:MAG: TetR/AcrR family transcriptional regulator [Rhizobiaceae bacterium]